ncbi:MAG: exodeoxyribonuclease VII large subunit [Candidatus Latescibacterota bacterium]|nr:exodeoxyribonuclease VII large subunit [Candidatus Latescibacterota bacterium]
MTTRTGPDFEAAGLPGPLSVSEITAQVKTVIEETLPFCWVEGEVSDFTRSAAGHCYLTLADENSQLSCVFFRSYAQQLQFLPEPGTQVLVYGNISVYERGGRYQFYGHRMRPLGMGDLALAFEQLRARLDGEGLFDAERKRPLPIFPRSVGLVTSPTGAAVRDMVQVLGRRAPGIQVILAPAQVQGPEAPRQICAAIDRLNRFEGVDILIVGRGGGSPEDLWPFNDEAVARAIYASRIPVVSAVGHEIDSTVSDYVADVRAPTPSAAAELVAQERAVLSRRIADLQYRLRLSIGNRLGNYQRELNALDLGRRVMRLRDHVDQQSQRLDETRIAHAEALDRTLVDQQRQFEARVMRLQTASPLATLARGFAYCERQPDGEPVRVANQLVLGDRLRLRFSQGQALAQVEEIDP